jgi:hypothetical protein
MQDVDDGVDHDDSSDNDAAVQMVLSDCDERYLFINVIYRNNLRQRTQLFQYYMHYQNRVMSIQRIRIVQ